MTKTRSNGSSIDLRSDTVSTPTPPMRRAIAEAEVGDDVLDGDPTTRKLEIRVAELLGHEAALFFPTGTQANQTAIGLHVRAGGELVLDDLSHMLHREQGGAAALWGAQLRAVSGADGVLSADLIAPYLRTGDALLPRTAMISVENSHNAAGGRLTSLAAFDEISRLAAEHGVPLHLDGARLWNAVTALRVPAETFGALADTVMVSFSKGLGCPAGSCLAGSATRMETGRALRQRLGGGMRQSGILAAACLYAIDHHMERLCEDHERAAFLAQELCGVESVSVRPPETNIVMIDLKRESAVAAEARLREAGVLLSVFGPHRLRAVTHLNLNDDDIDRAADRIGSVLSREAA